MLPTPSTSHLSFDNIYEPAEDSFLLLDTLSCPSEVEFLSNRFSCIAACPLVIEIGPGSGVVLAFVTAHAASIFSRSDIITFGIDLNREACKATVQTVRLAQEHASRSERFLDTIQADLGSSLRDASADVLIFNPPYVPTEESPADIRELVLRDGISSKDMSVDAAFESDSRLLALSYAGGLDGMETTNQFIDQLPTLLHPHRGVAYLLLCAGNKPREVIKRIETSLAGFHVIVAGHSGKKAGRETLQILRIWRADDAETNRPS